MARTIGPAVTRCSGSGCPLRDDCVVEAKDEQSLIGVICESSADISLDIVKLSDLSCLQELNTQADQHETIECRSLSALMEPVVRFEYSWYVS